jgi:choline dehydrogenase
LQHSGIGDANHLRSVGVEPVIDMPEVGENLQDHLFGHVKFEVNSKKYSINHKLRSTPHMAVEMLKWLVSGNGILASSTSHFCAFFKSNPDLARADIQLAMRPFSYIIGEGTTIIDDFSGITMSAIQTRPYSRGSVKIKSNDPTQRPRVDANYLADDRDVEILLSGMRQIRKIATMPSLKDILSHEVEPGPGNLSDEELTCYLRQSAATVAHPTSTIRMGSDFRAPLTPRLKLRGLEGLRVADASIMPQITSGNTNAPSIMIGEMAAYMILEDAANS